MAVVVAVVVVMPRLMMPHVRRRRRCVMRNFMSWRGTHRSVLRNCRCPSMCFRRLRRMLGRSRSLCRVRNRRVSLRRWRFLRRCLHRRRSLALRRRVPLRSGHRRATESAAHRERHNHLLYCLVHCRVPFVIRASPFSRLQKDRTIRRNFLTKDFNSAKESHQTRWRAALARVAFRREGRALAHHDGKSPTRGNVAGFDHTARPWQKYPPGYYRLTL